MRESCLYGSVRGDRGNLVPYRDNGELAMPSGRKPEGDAPMSNAERQARYRLRHPTARAAVIPLNRRPDRRSRPQRWRDAVAELLALQSAYADWLDALPEALQGTATAEALQAIADLDLETLASVDLPRGYGRD